MAEVIVALDVLSAERALRLVDDLPDLRWVKVGSVLFVREGPAIVEALHARKLNVFLDLKWHDIPNTVAGAVQAAAESGVRLATVHALGGAEMIRAAVRSAGTMRLAAVTVLTSHPPAEDESVRLAMLAVEAGAGAVVTSAGEAAAIRRHVGPDPWIVVPGIRPRGAPEDDQRRTATAAQALAAGATHMVVGRPILRAEKPREVYSRLCEEASS